MWLKQNNTTEVKPRIAKELVFNSLAEKGTLLVALDLILQITTSLYYKMIKKKMYNATRYLNFNQMVLFLANQGKKYTEWSKLVERFISDVVIANILVSFGELKSLGVLLITV